MSRAQVRERSAAVGKRSARSGSQRGLWGRGVACWFWLGMIWLSTGLFGPVSVKAQTGSDTVVFEFSEPRRARYQIVPPLATGASRKNLLPRIQWLEARPESGRGPAIEFGNRIVLELANPDDLEELLKGTPFHASRRLSRNLFIVEGEDTWTALQSASELVNDPRVIACHPVARRPKVLHGAMAARPNDPYFGKSTDSKFPWQAHLENRDLDGTRLGVDLNVREAWAVSRGEGVIVAVADDGVELTHPDLAPQAEGSPHFNFSTYREDGLPAGSSANHGTAVAGLAVARGDNKIGISGVAPRARLASWVLFNARDRFVISDEALMDMFQYRSNVVSVQNHSWGNDSSIQFPISALEDIGISNAVTFGRSGLGTVMVRAGGNGRDRSINANDDGYLTDSRVIGVAAVRLDGRFARYGSPGACLLVAAPSGDEDPEGNACSTDSPNLLTTDRQRAAGYNSNTYTNDLANYGFGSTGFNGTSASTPLISGVAALILSANPDLSYRDVQQILVLSSRHDDKTDPDLVVNGAGLEVSHNLGFGVPDAGIAVRLARTWKRRPEAEQIRVPSTRIAVVPDQGLRLLVSGESVPPELESIIALPSLGRFPDEPTRSLSAFDAGMAIGGISENLTGQAALIERGEIFFCEKLEAAAASGAEFAVVYNNRDTSARLVMGATEFVSVPSVFINQRDGEALRELVRIDPSIRLKLNLEAILYSFKVSQALLCEHVTLRVNGDHTARGDLRITLRSPQGTLSVLQSLSDDDSFGPVDWGYMSTHHFFESSQGEWTVSISDIGEKGSGSIRSVELVIDGVPITDQDADGLEDDWELQHLGGLASGAGDDPDGDGYSNAWEQVAGSDPMVAEPEFEVSLTPWNDKLARLSWPGKPGTIYRVSGGNEPVALQSKIADVPGAFPETELFVPYSRLVNRFFQIEALPDGRSSQ